MKVHVATENVLVVVLLVVTVKLLVVDKRDKTAVQVVEFALDLKEDNFHYLDVYLKEDSIIMNLELSMQ